MVTKEITLKIHSPLNIHPVNTALGENSSVRRNKILQLKLLDDGTTILLYQLSGDQATIEHIFESHSSVLSWKLIGEDEFLAFIHAESSVQSETILSLLNQHEIILLFPINHLDDGSIIVRLIGKQQSLGEVTDILSNITVLTVERVGMISSSTKQESVLTARQREIAELAFDHGYYNIPREADTRDLANLLDVAPETVHEHIRKINYRLLGHELRG